MSSLEEELLELGGDISAALENLNVPAGLLDRDGIIRWQNRRSIALRGDHVGSEFAALIAPDEQPDARSLLTRLLCQGEPAEFTLRVMKANGDYAPAQLSAVPVREGGAVVAVFGLSHEIKPANRQSPQRAGIKLAKRELDVLRLLADGKSTDEIASLLSLSPVTVRNYIARLLSTLGVHSRLQAVLTATKAGLLEP